MSVCDKEQAKEEEAAVWPNEDKAGLLHSPEEVEAKLVFDDANENEEKEEDNAEEENKRETWDTKMDYIMSVMGCVVGLGNIWRFPYLCYKNGGGAFLLPYLVMLFLIGMPLFLIETSMSQFHSTGVITLYSVCPALKGSGYTCIVTSMIAIAYYSLIVTYPLMFLYYSFSREVPWGSCDNIWNTPQCYLVSSPNATAHNESIQFVSSADEFFHRKILDISDGIGDKGDVVWSVWTINMFVWIFSFLCIFKGIQITGKMVWFTATFPIIMLVILLVRGVTLPGASDGLYYYLYPDFEKIMDRQVWTAAATQIFFSLGPGLSGVITMGSYNKFNNNSLKDSILLPILNCFASFLAGFVVFSVLGFMAHKMGTTVDKVTAAGPALVFVTYPEALSMMPMAPFWSFLFFSMLFFVGVDSLFVVVEAMISSIIDRFSELRKRRILVTVVVCVSLFLMGTAFCTQDGMYVLQLLDWYSCNYSPVCVCLCEIFIFSYSYGIGRTIQDIQMMTKQRVNYFWYFCLLIVTPIILMMVIVNQTISFVPASYRGITFPNWAQTIGWILALGPSLIIPIYLVTFFCQSKGSFKQRVATGFTPLPKWGPALATDREEWEKYRRENPLRHRLLHPGFPPSSDGFSGFKMIPISLPRKNYLSDF